MALLTKRAQKRKSHTEGLVVLQSPALQKVPWLVHGFSTRTGGASSAYGKGALNLGFTKSDTRENVEANRRKLLTAIGAADKSRPWKLVALRQVHSDMVHVVRGDENGPLTGDGLITNVPKIALGIMTADCFPVLLVDTRNKAVGAFHAGWRGTAKRIVEKGLGAMRREYGSRAEDIRAAIGPGVQGCCYEVGEELKAEFESQFAYGEELFHTVQGSDLVREKYPMLFMNARAPGHGDLCLKFHLDLQEANRRQLLSLGVPARQITAVKECTSCNTRKFFSYRAEKGNTGRMMAVIGITQ